jgi:hypothetical protein
MNPGFYKLDSGSDELLYAPNAVFAPAFTLTAETAASYTYPLDGWYWFDTEEEARFVLGLGQTPL